MTEFVIISFVKIVAGHEHDKINLLDGVFVEFAGAWVHVRPSNTEPVIRMSAEAPTHEAAALLLQETRTVLAPVIGT